MSTSSPPIKESRRARSVESWAISFSGLPRMSSSSNVRNSQRSRSCSVASMHSDSLRERLVGLDDEVGSELFMVLTISVGEVLVMRCFRKAQSGGCRREGMSLIRALGPGSLRSV